MDITRLITKYGSPIDFVHVGAPAIPDPAQPWRQEAPVETTTSITGALVRYTEKEVDGETILVGDQKILLAPASAPTITPQDYFRINGEAWHIVKVSKVPNELNVQGLIVQVRR